MSDPVEDIKNLKIEVGDVKKLGISPEWIENIFVELSTMDVPLEQEPLIYGPQYLAAKIAQCRNFLSRIDQIFNEISYRLTVAKRLKLRAEAEYTIKESHLLSNDPTIRAQRSVSDRKAHVVIALLEEMTFQQAVNAVLQDLENTLTVVKSKRIDLKDIQGRIKDQTKLCQEQLGLGAHWGSRLPPTATAPSLSNSRGYLHDRSTALDSVVDADDRGELVGVDLTADPDLSALLEAEIASPVSTGSISKMRAAVFAEDEAPEEEVVVEPAVAEEVEPKVDPEVEVDPVPVAVQPAPVPTPLEEVFPLFEEDVPPAVEKEVAPKPKKKKVRIETPPVSSDPAPAVDPLPDTLAVVEGDLQDFLGSLGVTEPIKSDPPKSDPPAPVVPESDPTLDEVISEAVGTPHLGDSIFEGTATKTAVEVASALPDTVSVDDVDSFFDAMDDNLEPENTLQSEEIDFEDLLNDL